MMSAVSGWPTGTEVERDAKSPALTAIGATAGVEYTIKICIFFIGWVALVVKKPVILVRFETELMFAKEPAFTSALALILFAPAGSAGKAGAPVLPVVGPAAVVVEMLA